MASSTMPSTVTINGGHGHAYSPNGINNINGLNGDHGLAGLACHAKGETAVETPVLVVGGGPTGLLLAHLLSRLGG